MGLFDRFKKTKGNNKVIEAKAENRIKDKELQEWIANAAVNQLIAGEDYESLDGLAVQFGYLFDFEGHLEALLKVVTDKRTRYFAVQGKRLLYLDLTEEDFQAYVDGMMKIHG